MKKSILAIMFLGILTVIAIAAGYPGKSFDVGVTSTLILPYVNPYAKSNNRTNSTAYTVGDYVRHYTNNIHLYFWCVTAGTSSNVVPTWSTTADTTDGTVTWRYINPIRNAFTIVNNGTEDNVYISYGSAAVSGSGITLVTEGGTLNAGYNNQMAYQGEVYAISGSGTNSISIHEE